MIRLADRIRRRWLLWRWRVWQERIIGKHGLACKKERAKRERIMEKLDEIHLRAQSQTEGEAS